MKGRTIDAYSGPSPAANNKLLSDNGPSSMARELEPLVPVSENSSTYQCTAMERVMDIGELRANVLRFLPVLDLFRVPRVSKAWRDTLKSPCFRKTLFLDPEQEPQHDWIFDVERQRITRLPFTEASTRNPPKRLCVPNDAIFNTPADHQAWEYPEQMGTAVEASLLTFRRGLDLRLLSTTVLHSMYLTQPPIKQAQILWYSAGGSCVRDLRNESGLRGSDVIQTIPVSGYPLSGPSILEDIKLSQCHLRVDKTWTAQPAWFAVSPSERERLEKLGAGKNAEIRRQKLYMTP